MEKSVIPAPDRLRAPGPARARCPFPFSFLVVKEDHALFLEAEGSFLHTNLLPILLLLDYFFFMRGVIGVFL